MIGAFDKDVSSKTARRFPQLYGMGIRGESLTWTKFILVSLEAVYQGLLVFFITVFSLESVAAQSVIEMNDRVSLGVILIIYTLWMANISVLLHTQNFTYLAVAATIFSNALVFFYAFVYAAVPGTLGYRIWVIFGVPKFYLIFPVIAAICWVPRICLIAALRHVYPTDTQIAQEIELQDNVNYEVPQKLPSSEPNLGSGLTSQNHEIYILSPDLNPSQPDLALPINLDVPKDVHVSNDDGINVSTLELSSIRQIRNSISLPLNSAPVVLPRFPQPVERRNSMRAEISKSVIEPSSIGDRFWRRLSQPFQRRKSMSDIGKSSK
jgi:hypothetical protein